MSKKVLLLQCRGLGDAIISTLLINSIHSSWSDSVIDVWASPEVEPFYREHPLVNRCYIQSLPILRRHKLSFLAFPKFIPRLFKLRSNHYDICINAVGDFRENILTSLVNAKEKWSVRWEQGHPLAKVIHSGQYWLMDEKVFISRSCRNIYDIYARIAKELGCINICNTLIDYEADIDGLKRSGKSIGYIGIHPFASQACRKWQFEKWSELISLIVELGYKVIIFGAPSERRTMDQVFKQWRTDSRVSFITEELNTFFTSVKHLSGYIGLDSFGIHAAFALGIPSVMINGANDPSIWAPPGTRVIGNGGGCKYYPCYNKPKCVGTKEEFICIKSVTVNEVITGLKTQLIKVEAEV
jgi:heptosyltransferase-3